MGNAAEAIVQRATDIASGHSIQANHSFVNYPYAHPTKKEPPTKNLFTDLGVPLSRFNNLYSYTDEQRISDELFGQRGIARLQNFATLSPLIGAYARLLIDRATDAEWKIAPREGQPKSDRRIKFLEQVYFEDLNRPFYDVVGEALSNYITGWSWFEVTYKKRTKKNSRFRDGKIGIDTIAMIPAETITEFLIDERYEIVAATQILDGNYIAIPLGKSLLFRHWPGRDPRGQTPMVNAYKAYCRQKLIENTESAGIENDATGTPFISVDTNEKSGADLFNLKNSDSIKTLNALQRIVEQVKGGQRAGFVLPSWQKPELLKSSGPRSFDAHLALGRYDSLILTPFLASHLLLPQGQTGSYSLAETLQRIFDSSLAATIKRIATTFTYSSIPKLLELNNMPMDSHPTMEVEVKEQSAPEENGMGPQAPKQRFNYDTDPKKQDGPGKKRQTPPTK